MSAEIEGRLTRFNIPNAINDPTVQIRGLDDVRLI